MIKLADKTSSLRSIVGSPPRGWKRKRKQDYFKWAREVANSCRGVSVLLEAEFDRAYRAGRRKGLARQS